MNLSSRTLFIALLLVISASCSAFADEDQVSDSARKNLAASVKQIFRSRCFECHGDTRRESDLNVLDYASLVGTDRPVRPSDLSGSVLYTYIASEDEDFRMPESPRPPLASSEIETVRQWIEAGAPEFPDDVKVPEHGLQDSALTQYAGIEYVLKSIVEFVEATPRDERKYLRFFSCNHLLSAGATRRELDLNRQAFAKAINHLSWQPDLIIARTVDGETASIFAIDIRGAGWHRSPFHSENTEAGAIATNTDFFDLVLLEYPYGIAFEHSELFDRLREIYLEPAGLIRPIPFVRIDWFVSTATQSPLYEDLLQLPHNLAELESLIGVDAESNVHSFVARRAGMTLSGVSKNNRVVERHPARYGAYWKSFDFQSSKGQQNMFADPLNFHFAGGEMIWSLPNGLQAYLVTDSAGHRLLEAPTSIVTDKFAEDKVVRNGLACMRCHDRGIKRFADNIRPAFETLPDIQKIDKSSILKLYATKSEMDQLLQRDEARFHNAMAAALGEDRALESLIPVSREFLEAPLTLARAAAELGVREPASLAAVFRLPQFTLLGLAGLSGGSVIRRDTWEDHFDQVALQLGSGIPIASVDGNTRLDQLADGFASGLTIQTNKRSNIFSPGETMVVSVINDTPDDLFVELVGTSATGRKVLLTNGVVSLAKGATLRFPESGEIQIKPQLGTEFITVFANPEPFEPGVLLRGDNLADRFVHDFYQVDPADGHIIHRPDHLVKKTLKIETK